MSFLSIKSKPVSPVAAFRDFLLKRKITKHAYRAVLNGDIPVEDWEHLEKFLLNTGIGCKAFAEAKRLWKRLQRQRS